MRDNWKKVKLGKYLKLQGGYAFSSKSFVESGVPLIRISNITEKGISKGFVFLSKEKLNNHSEYSLQNGDILIAMSGATTGKNCQITEKHLPALLNQRTGRFLIIEKEFLYNTFLLQLVNSNEFQNSLLIDAIGGAQPNISSGQIQNIQVYLPPLPQQKKIAEILSTCDAVLENTEAAIAKYQALKQGMLQDLFTRGIDSATGKLRPTQKEAPQLYKETELGFVPKEWEVLELKRLGEFKNGINKDKFAFGSGTPFVNISDAYFENLKLDKLGKVQVTASEKAMYKLEENDIIFTRSSVKPSGVGYTTIFKGSKDIIVYSGFMIRFRLIDNTENSATFLNYFFRSKSFRRNLINVSTVSANTNVNQDSLNSLFTIVPKIIEQNLITKKLQSIDKKIQTEQQTLAKYRQLKAGLMQDLLSGKVGVEKLVGENSI